MNSLNKYLFVTLFVLFICSCNGSKDNDKQIYALQYTNDSTVTNLLGYQLIRTSSIENDFKYVCEKYFKNQKESERCVLYKYLNNEIFEAKIICDFDKTPLDTLMVLNYSIRKDTSYHYFYDVQKYPPTKPFGTDDYFYSIVKVNNNLYAFYKENYVDSTYSELHFYDKEYSIIKIIKFTGSKFYEFVNERYKGKLIAKNSFKEAYFDRIKGFNSIYKYKTIETHD